MGTSSGGAGGFFTSRRNIVGMVLAVLVIVGHLAVGFGALWPIAAAAAWGVGALLTPPDKAPGGSRVLDPADAAPAVVKRKGPEELGRELENRFAGWSTASLPREVEEEIIVVHVRLVEALGNWARFESAPQHRAVVSQIITSDLPEVVDGYLAVAPDRRFAATKDVVDLLDLLRHQIDLANEDARGIADAEQRELERKRLEMELRFGPRPDVPDDDDGVPSSWKP